MALLGSWTTLVIISEILIQIMVKACHVLEICRSTTLQGIRQLSWNQADSCGTSTAGHSWLYLCNLLCCPKQCTVPHTCLPIIATWADGAEHALENGAYKWAVVTEVHDNNCRENGAYKWAVVTEVHDNNCRQGEVTGKCTTVRSSNHANRLCPPCLELHWIIRWADFPFDMT